jgi:hypothetical protein
VNQERKAEHDIPVCGSGGGISAAANKVYYKRRTYEDYMPQLHSRAAYARQTIRNALLKHPQYINGCGEDHPFVLSWKWGEEGAVTKRSSTEADNV